MSQPHRLRSDVITALEKEFQFWMRWMVAHQPQIAYEMERPFPLGSNLPMANDCSATFTNVRYLAGTVDPNGPSCPEVGHFREFDGMGNTTSLARFGQLVTDFRQLEIGDGVIYYNPYGFSPENTVHVAMLYDLAGEYVNNPLTMSHGWSEEPAFVTVESDGRPHQYFKFPNTLRHPVKPTPPKRPPAKGTPTAEQLVTANLVELKNPKQESIARSHGWTIWYFSDDHKPSPWIPVVAGKPDHVTLYANVAYLMMQ